MKTCNYIFAFALLFFAHQSYSQNIFKTSGKRSPKSRSWFLVKDTSWMSDKTTVLSGATRGPSGSLFAELLVDRINFWRVAFASALVSAPSDTTNNFQSFLAGGGNAIIRAHFPIVYFSKPDKLRSVGVFFAPRLSANIPALGGTADNPTWNVDIGVELHYFISGVKKQVALGGILRGAALYGSRDFILPISGDGYDILGYGQGSIGIILKETVSIMVYFPISLFGLTDPIDKLPTNIGVGFSF